MKEIRQWTIKDSAELYNVSGWSAGYFRINDAGHVDATPLGPDGPSVDLYELVLDLKRRGLGLPLLVRFSDILDSRVRQRLPLLHTLAGSSGPPAREPRRTPRQEGASHPRRPIAAPPRHTQTTSRLSAAASPAVPRPYLMCM